MLYFMLHDAARFQQLGRALADAWRQRSFDPCRPLCRDLLPVVQSFAVRYHLGPEESLIVQAARGLPFARDSWRALAGELLLLGADEIPEIPTAAATLGLLLAPAAAPREARPREEYLPIEQAHFGTRDLFLGSFYRPEAAGCNERHDVGRLSRYLEGVAPERWTAADLRACPDWADEEEREAELLYARQCLAALQEMYRSAATRGQVIVCEDIQTPL